MAARDNFGKQLYIAAHDGNIKAMKSALSNGADINWENPDDLNYTPLHIAACFNKLEADSVQFLIRNNANIESRDTSGFTPLMRAAVNGSSQSLIILLQNGANATAINNDGKTALDRAELHGHTVVVHKLREHA
ncbi:PREDICTED: arf-GAP with coiled-coil, ANK repeat and PH domain-containing protein 2-like, partial [Amphimedon queenslandica]|uniref:Uncharacterized protein n=1 Tax=Amphimedon queenslandica TaxID=400682 RepID=A0AAN0JY51_AMPQE